MKKIYGFSLILIFIISYNVGKLESDNIDNDVNITEESTIVFSSRNGIEKNLENHKKSIIVKESWGKLIADKNPTQRQELFSAIEQIQNLKINQKNISQIESVIKDHSRPEDVFNALKKKADELSDFPVKQAEIYASMVKIAGMEVAVKKEIFNSLIQSPPPIEMKESEARSYEDHLRFLSLSPEELSFYIKYNSYAKLSINRRELLDQTIELFKEQKNQNVKIFLASKYLVDKGEFTNSFIDELGLDMANRLVTANIEIVKNIDGTYKFIDFILPRNK